MYNNKQLNQTTIINNNNNNSNKPHHNLAHSRRRWHRKTDFCEKHRLQQTLDRSQQLPTSMQQDRQK